MCRICNAMLYACHRCCVKLKGDVETFYPNFYKALIKLFDIDNSPFQELGYNCTLLLGFQLCNHGSFNWGQDYGAMFIQLFDG